MTTSPQTACLWCGHALSAAAITCSSCGAPINVPVKTDAAGWTELPGARDMAELTFGESGCQISGQIVPVADFRLAASASVYFAHHVLLWRDPSVVVRARSLKKGWKRILSGMPLVMTEAIGPGHIAFSRDEAGELLAVPLNPGQSIDVREHVFVAATGNVGYDWFIPNVWYQTRDGNETETHYPLGMMMDTFHADREPGLLLLHGAGNLFIRTLKDGESILVKPNALLFKDPSVSMHMRIEKVTRQMFGGLFSTTAPGGLFLWVRLTGPGRVAIQSADKHHHESSSNIVATSGDVREW